jgi:hypothetical protein
MARLYGRAGRLTAQNGCFWPGQTHKPTKDLYAERLVAEGTMTQAEIDATDAKILADFELAFENAPNFQGPASCPIVPHRAPWVMLHRSHHRSPSCSIALHGSLSIGFYGRS